MSIQELETQLLGLDRADQVHMLQLLERSLRSTAENHLNYAGIWLTCSVTRLWRKRSPVVNWI
jgi:hypothetical protein